MSLTAMQKGFAKNIARGMNQTQAAIEAGYSEKTAHVIGWENMRKPNILEEIDRIQETQDMLLRKRLSGIAGTALEEMVKVLVDDETPPQVKTNTAKLLLDYAGHKPVDKQETQLSGGLGINEQSEIIGKYLKGGDEG